MKRKIQKFAAVSLAAVMAVSMAGCTSTSKTEETGNTSIANPVKEVTEDEMVEMTGIDLPAPEGAENVRYSVIDMGDTQIAQMDFTLDGLDMYLRACPTDLTNLDVIEGGEDAEVSTDGLNMSKGDISGLCYEWEAGATQVVQEREAIMNFNEGEAGYIAWLDPVPGILYNLCMTEGATTTNLPEYANKVFVPLQGEN